MRTIFNKSLALIILSTLPALCQAADGTVKPDAPGSSYNIVLWALVTLMISLLFVIGVLGNVLKQLVLAHSERLREQKNKSKIAKTLSAIVGILFLSFHSIGAESLTADKAIAAAPVSPFIEGIPRGDFYAIMSFIGFELLIILSLLLLIRQMVRTIRNKPEAIHNMARILKRPVLDRFNKSVAVEHESAITLDHDYDGIRELDNDLPPWWRYGFILTIIVAFAYLWYYHVADGPNQIAEYTAEVQKGEQEKAEYLAKSASNVDENTVTMVADAAELDAAKTTFQSICAACHAKDGGGGVGPNLTDNYWLHGGTIKDVFKSVKYGWPDKGMKSWKDDFSPKQIAALATYVRSLKGTTPAAPKEKQGELFSEDNSKPADTVSKTNQVASAVTLKKEGN